MPKEIHLSFELDPNDRVFRGTAVYDLELDQRRRTLDLHSVGLAVASVRVQFGAESSRGRVEERAETEMISLRFDRMIPVGRIRLELSFRGRIRRDMRGLYGSGDGTENEGGSWIASQLCPTDARRLFPCFDEPGVKARYRICVTAPASETVLSNAPVESRENRRDGRQVIQFETTPPLSSYLVAIAVGQFRPSRMRKCGSTQVRVWSLPGKEHLTDFALEAAIESLARLERWFDMPHPYPKLDLVALPSFAFGAMENAGAVFFRDSILLLDAEEASLEDRKRTAEVIAHELSHMWFGNAVTMKWWNDLWLNEAFATWMAYEIIESWRPEWRIWLDFAHRREEALTMDALASSHAIAPPIRSAAEAQENFDAITYTKGASVLRMLERFLGADVFRDGIRLYMRRHAGSNADAGDLWNALSAVSKLRVEEIVAPWTLQTGYPLVSVHRPQRNRVEFEQERFLALPRKKIDSTRWTIPMISRASIPGQTHSNSQEQTREIKSVFDKRRYSLSASESKFAWIYPNDAEAGFFRVDHGEEGLRELLANLSCLSATERIGLLGNQWALCRCGRVPIASLLHLLAAFGRDPDPEVLGLIEGVLEQLARRLVPNSGSEITEAYEQWICDSFGQALDELSVVPIRDEDERRRLLRGQLFAIVGGLGRSGSIVSEAERRCAEHFAEGVALSGELAGPILSIAAKSGGEMLHSALCSAAKTAPTPQARRLYVRTLASFTSPERLASSLDAALDPDLAPAPDRAQLIAELLGHRDAAMPTWTRLQKCWKRLEKQMPPILLGRLVGAMGVALPPSEAARITAFYREHPLVAGNRVLSQVREELRIAARFEREARSGLEDFLRSR